MTFRDINALALRRQAELRALMPRAKDTVYGEVSPTWQKFFGERPNFLTPEKFNLFRNTSTSAIYGVGGHKDTDELAALFTQSITDIVNAQNIPDEIIASIAEPLLGSPTAHPYRGNLFSTPFLNNVASAWRTAQFARQFCAANRPLRVCEIGAGFGATAQILHQMLDIESYTVIDLAENLYLSSIFLPATLPGRSHQMVDGETPESFACRSQLNFSLASFTDNLTAAPFDLVLNRASMGEMTLPTARAYIAWIKSRLADDGIFYFHNRFNVAGANGAARLSDFGLQDMGIRFLGPMERMSRPTNQLHSEVVVSPARGAKIDPPHIDVIGDLIACGFDPQLSPLIRAALGDGISAAIAKDLIVLAEVFSPSPLQAKRQLLENSALNAFEGIRAVLLAVIDLISGVGADESKAHVLSLNLGLKLEVRMRGLYAEHEARHGNTAWPTTLAPLTAKSAPLTKMSEQHVKNAAFSGPFRRDLRVTP